LLHAEDAGGEARRLGGAGGEVGGEDQLRALGADDGVGGEGLAVFVRVGAAQQSAVVVGKVGLSCRRELGTQFLRAVFVQWAEPEGVGVELRAVDCLRVESQQAAFPRQQPPQVALRRAPPGTDPTVKHPTDTRATAATTTCAPSSAGSQSLASGSGKKALSRLNG